jgi:hypothetical protein
MGPQQDRRRRGLSDRLKSAKKKSNGDNKTKFKVHIVPSSGLRKLDE